jgi:hypothetical protein
MKRSLNGLLKFTEQSIFVDTRWRNKLKTVRSNERVNECLRKWLYQNI